MVRKFMKNKKIIIPILILIVSVIVIGLFYKVNKVRNNELTIEYAEGVDLDEGLYKVVAYCGGKPKDGKQIPSNLSHWNKNKDTAWEYLTDNLNKTTEGGGATDEGGGKDDEPDPYKATNIEGEFGKFEMFSD